MQRYQGCPVFAGPSKKHAINTLSSFRFTSTHTPLTNALSHQKGILIGNSEILMAWCTSALPYQDAGPSAFQGVSNVDVSVLQRTFHSDHSGPIVKQQNSFVLLPDYNGPNSGIWVAKVLLLFRVSVQQFRKQTSTNFADHEMHTAV